MRSRLPRSINSSLNEDTKMAEQVKKERNYFIKAEEVMMETKLMLENMDVTNCIFRK